MGPHVSLFVNLCLIADFDVGCRSIGTFIALAPNIISHNVLRWYLRFAVLSATILFISYNIWFPIKVSN